MISCIM
nr:BLTX640 [Nephila pilipes]